MRSFHALYIIIHNRAPTEALEISKAQEHQSKGIACKLVSDDLFKILNVTENFFHSTNNATVSIRANNCNLNIVFVKAYDETFAVFSLAVGKKFIHH